MNLPSYLVYAPLVMVFLLELLAIGVLVAYFSFLKRYHKLEDQHKQLEDQYRQLVEKAESEARAAAAEIVNKATQQANSMISQANTVSKTYGEQFAMEMRKVAMEQMVIFQKVLEGTRQETATTLKGIADQTRTQALKEIEVLSGRLTDQAKQSQTVLAQAISQAFQKAEAEIVKYKENRLAYVESHSAQILEEVIREVLPKGMTVEQHDDLVMAAIAEANKQHFFGMQPVEG
jgi:hypothetical protein